MINSSRLLPSLVLAALALLAGGCASTAPQAKFARELPVENRVAKGDDVTVTVITGSEGMLQEYEKARLTSFIKTSISNLSAANPTKTTPAKVVVELTLTRYEKGNAFARAMLAGLGQIHIDGKVRLLNAENQAVIAEFDLKKTFAWGGMYGATVSMEDIEKAFAEGVAAAVTGQQEKEKK